MVGLSRERIVVAGYRPAEPGGATARVPYARIEARTGGTLLFTDIAGPVRHTSKLGRDPVDLGPWRLYFADADALAVAALAEHAGPARLAHAIALAFERGDLAATASYLREAARRDDVAAARVLSVRDGRGASAGEAVLPPPPDELVVAHAAPTLATIAAALDRPGLALALLAAARDDAAPPVSEVEARAALANGGEAGRADLQEALLALEVDEVAPPVDYPWPPARPAELLAAAAARAGDLERARSLLADVPEPRRAHAILALDDAPAPAWRELAPRYAEAGAFADARAALRRPLAEAPTAADFVRDAAWATLAGDPEGAQEAFLAALVADMSTADVEGFARALRSTDALPSFEALAETSGSRDIAARLTVERLLGAHADDATIEAAAERCATLGAPREAALLVEEHARRLDERGDASAARWLEAARLRIAAEDARIAAVDLGAAVAADFLRPETLGAALAMPGAELPDDVARWWRHLFGCLSGDAVDRQPIPPKATLSSRALDTLHPGGIGWLDQVRSSLQEPERPPRATLVRGLERLGADSYGDAVAIIDALSAALDLAPPETFVYRGDDAYGVCGWPLESPLLLVGYQHLDDGPRRLSKEALRFVLAVELTHLACRHPLLGFESDFLGTSHSVYQTFGKYAGAAETVVDVVSLIPGVDQLAKLQRIVMLSKRVFTAKSAVDKVGALAGPLSRYFGKEAPTKGIGRVELEGAAVQFRLQADRAALLLTGDFCAAVEGIVLSSPEGPGAWAVVGAKGLARALAEPDVLRPVTALRLSSLAQFAANEMP